ncbi:NAD+ synthase, partial [Luteimonas sp. J16]|uniref:asparagine synthase-related protein n=2 Tax=unclassified Luteimonas TaxID=2629088 RepID=UPI0011ADA731
MGGLEWSVLDIDYGREAERICAGLREAVATRLRRRGVVVAISGGIDSSVCAALAVRAFGPGRVHLLILPEHDSDPDSAARANLLASHLGVEPQTFDIAPALEAIGAYAARDAAVRTVLPEYDDRWKMKLAISGGSEGAINRFRLVARSPDGAMHERELRLHEYLTIVAATSYKQRL